MLYICRIWKFLFQLLDGILYCVLSNLAQCFHFVFLVKFNWQLILYLLEVASLISPFDNSDVSFRQKLDLLTKNYRVNMQNSHQNCGIKCHVSLGIDVVIACLKS